MVIRGRIFTIFALVLLTLSAVVRAQSDMAKSREHQIKAAFLYNFIKFINWPDEKMPDNEEPIIIGVVNAGDFTKAFGPIKDKKVKNKKVVVKEFRDLSKLEEGSSRWEQEIDEFKKCHILFFYDCSDNKVFGQAIEALSGSPVLTVGCVKEFLKSGGNINFLLEDKKVRFEINFSRVKRNNLKISSKLLKLAKRVIE